MMSWTNKKLFVRYSITVDVAKVKNRYMDDFFEKYVKHLTFETKKKPF